MRWALVCVLVGACYRPNAPEGAPCGANGACPAPLHCDELTNTCISGDGAQALCTFRDVAAGRMHTCALDATGAVWCWGLNDTGQSAPGDASRFALAATRIALPGPAAQVAAGRGFSCARLETGAIYCWGDNARGELGPDAKGSVAGPTEIPLAGDRAIDLGIGSAHACIRRAIDQAVLCWGRNDHLQLGTTGIAMSPTPLLVPNTGGAKQLSVGHNHSCIVAVDDTAQCWGRNGNGQLGNATGDRAAPQPVTGLAAVARVRAGGRLTCALETAGGAVRCWGQNDRGQLGRGDFTGDVNPGSAAANNATDIQVGAGGACALLADTTVACWAELSVGDGSLEMRPSARLSNVAGVAQLASGYYHSCAIGGDGRLVCWGSNDEGELGRGTRWITPTPQPVTSLTAPVSAFGVGRYGACAIATTGELSCWGRNKEGQLGDNTLISTVTPHVVASGLPEVDGVAVGAWHTCFWGGGIARCMGGNENGECGDGTKTPRAMVPVTVANVTAVTQLGLGWDHTCAIDGANLRCWGTNGAGQLGNGTTTSSPTPVLVANIASPTKLAVGRNHACAIAAGALSCWGANGNGQLGDGTTTNATKPVKLTTFADPVIDVAAGTDHTCALTQPGTVFCWGANTSGELGLGTTDVHRTPVAVSLPAPALQVTAGEGGTCARTATATYCWGRGDHGELGDGLAQTSSLTPLAVPGLDGIDLITRNDHGACARKAGTLLCWGTQDLVADGDLSQEMAAAPIVDCR